VSQLKLRGKATEPAQNPLIQNIVVVCDHAKGGNLFQSGCHGIQAVVVDHVEGERSREVQGINKHATMLPSRQHVKKTSTKLYSSVDCECFGGMLESENPRAMGRLAFWPRRADGAVALIQVACSIYQGNASLFLGYVSRSTMLLVSESGASRKK
jgi:hypothetical protein